MRLAVGLCTRGSPQRFLAHLDAWVQAKGRKLRWRGAALAASADAAPPLTQQETD